MSGVYWFESRDEEKRTAVKVISLTIEPIPGSSTEITSKWSVADDRLEDGATIAKWTVRDLAQSDVNVNLQILFSLGLDEGSPFGRGDIIDNLHLIGRYVGQVRNQLIPILRGG